MIVILTGHLSPPRGPAEPGGFDFRRHAWFQQLGAVGYTRTPVLRLEPGQGLWVSRARQWLSNRIQSHLTGETGAFAAAITTGDRSGLQQGTLDALRVTNLAHLLAISGLHMGLLAGFVFAALRLLALASPALALRYPVKKYAAAGALSVAAGYLALSGGNVATERAFVMVAVVLGAVIVERRALSLRAVALAAVIILTLQPEALLGPGFQMSFAATTALVGVFGALRDAPEEWRLPRWLAPVAAVFASSAVAGAATAPFGMAHFNQIAHYGLLANLVSVPLMGLLVIPAAVVAVGLMPLGLEGIPLRVMGWGLDWILGVAHSVSDWPEAAGQVVAPGPWVLPLLSIGALFVILWQGRLRWAGSAPVALAIALWSQTERPHLLISDDARLVGLMTEAGRALSRPKGAGFVAQIWLENDGAITDQAKAAAKWGTPGDVRHLVGKRAAAAFQGCAGAKIIVSSQPLAPVSDCLVYTAASLERTGALAFHQTPEGLVEVSAASLSGRRLWSSQ